MNKIQLTEIIEAILFSASAPVTVERLTSVLEEFEKGDISEALSILGSRYSGGHGVLLEQAGGGYQLRTNSAYSDYIRRFNKTRAAKFSRSTMEALSIIAYRQPVTRAEIEYLRGVDTGGILKSLLDKKLVKIIGKKDVPGKPLIYGTTKEFLVLFGLKELASLPSLKDVSELVTTDTEQCELPLEITG